MWLPTIKNGQLYLDSTKLAKELIENKEFKEMFSNEETHILLEGILGYQLDLENINKKIVKDLYFIKSLFYIGEVMLFLTLFISLIILITK